MAYVTSNYEFIGTNKNGVSLYLKSYNYEFCDDIWNYILEFTGWKYSFDLTKLGIEPLTTILRYNFGGRFTNIKNSNISLEYRKKCLIKTIYKTLQKKASKNVYENICGYFSKKTKKIKTFDESIQVGDEVVFKKKGSWNPYLAGVVTKISEKRTSMIIKAYDYRYERDIDAIKNQTHGQDKYYYDKTKFRCGINKIRASETVATEKINKWLWDVYKDAGAVSVDYGN